MTETLDQLLRTLQGAPSLGLEKKVETLTRVRECLVRDSSSGIRYSHKALEGVITALPPILGSSQVIACQAALECAQPLIEAVARESVPQVTKSLLHFILPALLDRLGDGRMAVRELALVTLVSMWKELDGGQSAKPSTASPSPSSVKPGGGSRYSAIANSIPKFTTPFKSRILGKSRVSLSPSSPQWSPAATLERDIKARGFLHKTWRVREMLLEWLSICVNEHPEFPASHYLADIFLLLDDSQDAVRFASKRALNTIYHSRPEMQGDIVNRAQALVPPKPGLLAAITAPEGELAPTPASPFVAPRSGSRQAAGIGGPRPGSRITGAAARPGSRTARAPSRAEPAGPSQHSRLASHGTGIPRPGSRTSGQPYGSQQAGAQGPSPRPAVTEPNKQSTLGTAYRSGYRSMSQQGYRPGSRTGFTGALSPGRTGNHQSPLHSKISSPSPSVVSRVTGSPSPAPSSLSTSNYASQSPSASTRRTSNMANARNALQRQPSVARLREPFVPCRIIPGDVKVHSVPSRQSLAGEFSRTTGFFGGKETEDNWVQRERAINLYRGIVWGNSAIEFCNELTLHFKESMHEIFATVNSLRTSLSGNSMLLCEDVALRLGPHAIPLFDTISDVLLKQCAQTKKLSAQKAARSLEVVFQHFPLRPKSVDLLRQRISDKSPVLRQAVVAVCTATLRHHGPGLDPSDRRCSEIFALVCDIAKSGLVDALPEVRRVSRELFWELHSASALHAKKLMAMLPESTRAALNKDRAVYARSHRIQDSDRPMSAASIVRPPSNAHSRLAGAPRTQGVAREASIPSLMNVVAGYSPNSSPLAGRSVIPSSTADTPLIGRTELHLAMLGYRSQGDRVDEVEEAEDGGRNSNEDDDDNDSVIFQPTGTSSQPPTYPRSKLIEASAKSRISLGLIDFSNMNIGPSLLEVDTPPPSSATVQSPKKIDEAIGVTEAEVGVEEEAEAEATLANSAQESQVAVGALVNSMELDSIQQGSGHQTAGSESKHTSPAEMDVVPVEDHFPTPERTPLMSPSPPSETRHTISPTLQQQQQQTQLTNQLVTPRTQTARYWNGPVEPPLQPSIFRQAQSESPLPKETPQRLNKIEQYIRRLTDNDSVDEALFRSLARFAKEEPSSAWLSESKGGQGYLDRVLLACLGWLQNPSENRDTVFTKDSCFDVLRVLVRKKSQCFTLDTARLLLLEILRNRFFESTILSGSAEDVFYDMAAHLDADLCFALIEDYFQRAPLPSAQGLGSQKPGYAACTEPALQTPASLDPMNVFGMDNALAGVLELAAEVVKRLPSRDTVTQQEMDKFMPYSMSCFVHPRSQVRKAALGPIIAVHEKSGIADSEFELLLLRASDDQLAASANPLAKYIGQLSRPELRRLVWTYYLSKRSA
ncbi:suppressor of tub2 mutation [Dipsacomyces acuminosporus]|nr:suppressor of tub2 mutation [Dipsacomyces acuminosporus]